MTMIGMTLLGMVAGSDPAATGTLVERQVARHANKDRVDTERFITPELQGLNAEVR